ncbi:MAG TPA: hypothetical protein PLV32_15155, partial [Chitinophagaceae bacterium]|nr:hypothetical protein [Chitinophagaceae bacterium]
LNPDGQFIYKASFRGEEQYNSSAGRRMVTDHENNLYITGHFTGIIDFDPGPGKFTITSGSPWTPFVVKFGPCMSKTTSELVVQACNRYSLIRRMTAPAFIHKLCKILRDAIQSSPFTLPSILKRHSNP